MDAPELNACPFCGGEHAATTYVRDGRQAWCPDCHAAAGPQYHGPSDIVSADERAKAAWNRRADLTIPTEGAALVWSEPKPPNGKDCLYDHVDAETPLGLIRLEWKSWKDYDAPCGQMPWDEFVTGNSLDAAKAAAQSSWSAMMRKCGACIPTEGAEWDAMVERAARALFDDDEDASEETERNLGVDLGPRTTFDDAEWRWPETAEAFRRRARAALRAALTPKGDQHG